MVAPPAGLTYNVFLIAGDEPLLFHTGRRSTFSDVAAAIVRVMPLDRLCWITFGHYESDECGAMNEFLAAAPQAQITHGNTACRVSLNDMAARMPRALADGEAIELSDGDTSTRRTFPTAGRRVCFTRSSRARCYAATCSRRPAKHCR